MKHTQIAANFSAWREYFDTGANMDEGTFDGLSMDQRIDLLEQAFGPDKITRYFDATIDGWRRITVVTGSKDSDFDGFHDEIEPEDLPPDFSTWQRYDVGASGLGMSFKTLSADGG